MSILFYALMIIVTLIVMGFFAGMEIAFVSVDTLAIELAKKNRNRGAISLSKIGKDPANFISACLIGFNLFLVLYGLLFTSFLDDYMYQFIPSLKNRNHLTIILVDSVFSTILLLLFGEFLPKAYFKANAQKMLLKFASVILFTYRIFNFVILFFVSISEFLLEFLFNVRVKRHTKFVTYSDIENFFLANKKHIPITDNYFLLENAIKIPTRSVKACMLDKAKIDAIDINTDIKTLQNYFIQTKRGKLIVFDGSIDNVLGYVHYKSLFKSPKSIKDILFKLPSILDDATVGDCIMYLTNSKKSIAIIVDADNKVQGLITIEDLIEEIFGEINDEYDTLKRRDEVEESGDVIISGVFSMKHLLNNHGIRLNKKNDDRNNESIAAFLLRQLGGQIPALYTKLILNNYEVTILQYTSKSIELIKIKKIKNANLL